MFAQAALIVLGLIVFNNYRSGQLGAWLKAKFFNAGDPIPDTPGGRGRSGLRGGESGGGGGGGGGASWASIGSGRAPAGAGDGPLAMPVTGTLTGRFGDPRPGRRHAGVDWSAPTGTPVRAARAGRVTWAGSSSGYGLRVDVDHGGGLVTRYAHLSRIAVRIGQEVAGGATIGQVGNTGTSTGPHLHFEVRRGGVAVDPLPLVAAGLPGGAVA